MSDIELPWLPGGSRGGDKLRLKDRQQYLMVVRLAGSLGGGPLWMDWHAVEVENDEDGFLFQSNGWVWRWEDVEWCLPLASLKRKYSPKGWDLEKLV